MKNLIFTLFVFSCAHDSLIKAPLLPGHTRAEHEAYSNKVMIATQGKASTEAGLLMIKKGGNLFDAFAAVSFAISVERPHSTGLGGGGFAVIDHKDWKNPKTFDFREKAPLRATEKMYLDKMGTPIRKLSLNGPLAAGVPGLVHGVLSIHQKYGKLPLSTVIQPAIDLANKGFKVYPNLANAISKRKEALEKHPASLKIFYKNGAPLKEGELLVQKDLAKTLKEIANKGANGFYRGWVAKKIVQEMKRTKGLISHKDLKLYKTIERKPITGNYKGYDLYSMGPPSSGGTHVIQILNILEGLNLNKKNPLSVDNIHKVASSMQLSFVDRARYMGDPDFVKIPLTRLTSKAYASKLRQDIKKRALKIDESILQTPEESSDTTHFTLMDHEGNVISSTQTINYLLGSGQVIPGTGIVMNDEMDDFATKVGAKNVFGAVGGDPNKIAPQKRPLSSMSPTIVKKDGRVILSLGTPSGTRILTCVAQTILNYLEYKLPLYDSVALMRYHHQWRPDLIRVGPPFLPEKSLKALQDKGYKIRKQSLGCKVQAIAWEKNRLHGVSDPRGEGQAKGL